MLKIKFGFALFRIFYLRPIKIILIPRTAQRHYCWQPQTATRLLLLYSWIIGRMWI